MKKTTLLLFFLGLAALLTACGTVNSATGGFTDEAFVKVASDNPAIIKTSVQVTIDGQNPQEVIVLSTKKVAAAKPHLILKPGTYTIRITDKAGNVLYNTKIFLSTRKTKVIELH